jgi:hypothetical protein
MFMQGFLLVAAAGMLILYVARRKSRKTKELNQDS